MTFQSRVITRLQELADEDFQRRVWLARTGPEVSSYDEAICGLFDDTGLNRQLEKGNSIIFTSEIDDSLRQLRKLTTEGADVFQYMPPLEVIEHQLMRQIRCVASKVLAQMDQEGIA